MPQGSNSLLFLLFINDLTEVIDCDVLVYADDVKLFSRICSRLDCHRLQNQLDILGLWSACNKLHLNTNKCAVVTYSRAKNKIIYPYSLDSVLLSRCDLIKDRRLF